MLELKVKDLAEYEYHGIVSLLNKVTCDPLFPLDINNIICQMGTVHLDECYIEALESEGMQAVYAFVAEHNNVPYVVCTELGDTEEVNGRCLYSIEPTQLFRMNVDFKIIPLHGA